MASSVLPPSSSPQGVELPTISVEDFDLDLAHLGQDQIAALYTRGVHVVVALITAILAILGGVLQDNQVLRERVTDLEHQLHRDSHNSVCPEGKVVDLSATGTMLL